MERRLFATRLDRTRPPGPQLERAAELASVALLARMEAGLPIDPRDLQALTDLLLVGDTVRGVRS